MVHERRWLVSDTAIASALATHPVVPIEDVAQQRPARVVAFVLGLLALPCIGQDTLDQMAVCADPEEVGRRLAMPPRAVADVLRALFTAGILRTVAGESRTINFDAAFVVSTSLATAIRWPLVLARLTDPPRQGTQAALMLFRLLLDELSHPGEARPLAHAVVTRRVGLQSDQIRRGIGALLEAGLWEADAARGRRTSYSLGADILTGASAREPLTIGAQVHQGIANTGAAPGPTEPRSTSAPARTVLVFGNTRIVIPPSVRNVTLPEAARRVTVQPDAETGDLVVAID